MDIQYSQTFNATPEQIWPYLEESDKMKLWMKGLLEDEATSEGPTRVGSTFRMKIQEGKKVQQYDGVVTEYKPHELMGVKFWGGSFKEGMEMHAHYHLVPVTEKRTRIDYHAHCDMQGVIFKCFGWLFAMVGKTQIKGFFKSLDKLL